MTEGVRDVWPSIFCDWFAATQFHSKGGLPAFVDGVSARFDGEGNCLYERGLSARAPGSYDTSVRFFSDGYRVGVSGNVGRFGREDNLFNLGWCATRDKASRILEGFGLPALTGGERRVIEAAGGPQHGRVVQAGGAGLSRIDITANYSAGSEAQARAVIKWLQGQSVRRLRRGFSGDESVWWASSRMMLKAYRKGAEMAKHGGDKDLIEYANDVGLVRVELELKKRELSEEGLIDIGNVTQERLEELFARHTEPFRRIDSSDEPDILTAIPSRSRAYAAAWLGGQDVRLLCSQATLYRHAKVLRGYGLDILEPRNIERFPIKVRVIDLVPLECPEWYRKKVAA